MRGGRRMTRPTWRRRHIHVLCFARLPLHIRQNYVVLLVFLLCLQIGCIHSHALPIHHHQHSIKEKLRPEQGWETSGYLCGGGATVLVLEDGTDMFPVSVSEEMAEKVDR